MLHKTQPIQEQTLKYIILSLVLAGLAVGLTAVWFDGFSSPWLLRSLALIVVAFIAYALHKAGQSTVAAYVLVLELIGIIAGMFLQPAALSGITPYLFIPLIIIAGLILSPSAILIITLFSITLTLLIIVVTGQFTLSNLIILISPFGLMLLVALSIMAGPHYRAKLSNLFSKSKRSAKKHLPEVAEAQEEVDALQQRVTKLQQQVLPPSADQIQPGSDEQDSKLYELVQRAIREIDSSVSQLEDSIDKVAQAGDEDRPRVVETLWGKIDYLTTLVVNLEELVRLEKRDVELNYRIVDVSLMLNEVANTTRGLVGDKAIQIRTQIPDGLPPLKADPALLRQALLHLMNNAVKYTDEGHIELQAELNEQELTIFVSDTGVGIPQDEIDVIFEGFGRGSTLAAQGRQGAGLGLTVSKYLVELHQGRMWSTSVPGVGSTFYLALPLEPALETVLEPQLIDEETVVLAPPQMKPEIEPVVAPTNDRQPAYDPEATIPSLALQGSQNKKSDAQSKIPKLPSLPPVARFSPTYISRFGLSLLGLLVIIGVVVAVLALINPPIEETTDDTAIAQVTSSAGLTGEPTALETPASAGGFIIATPTPLATNTATPTAMVESLPTEELVVVEPTATATQVIVPPTATPTSTSTSTPLPNPTATATALPPTATLVPPSPTPVPPTPTATEEALPQAVPAASAEPTMAPSTHLSFAIGNRSVATQNIVDKLEANQTITLETAANSRLAWSPDGQDLLFTSDQDGNREIYLTDVSGGHLVNLTQSLSDDQQPSWSPDGKKVAFSSGRNGNFDIYVMNIDGSGLTQLTTSRGFDEWPVWSPDGRQIAFTSDRDGGNLDVYVMNVDGSNQRRLTEHPANDGPATWAPDSHRLVFASERDGNANLYVINTTGGTPVRLTNDAANEQAPVWSPDGRTIAFAYDSGQTVDVYTIPAPTGSGAEINRSQWTQVTNTPSLDEDFPVWLP